MACTAIYGMYELNINLGSDYTPGQTYTVRVNDKTVTSIRFERSEKDGEQAFNVSFHMGNKTVTSSRELTLTRSLTR